MRRTAVSILALAAGCSAPVDTSDAEVHAQGSSSVPVLEAPAGLERMKAAELGFEFVRPRTEDGFVVGGVNDTAAIRELTALNGIPIEDLERQMRPGAPGERGSDAGFLGPDERLVDVLALDNRFVVDELGRTHQDLARPLLLFGHYAKKHGASDVTYAGVPFHVDCVRFRGYQESPFQDDTRASIDVTIENRATGRSLTYSLLVPHMIERYGFYEGRGTSYRVEPERILEVLQPTR